jgi:nucleoside-diphosphate-sugar epimerase
MRVYVAGHRGMVGGAILRRLLAQGVETITRTHAEFWPPRRWAEFMPTTRFLPASFTKI